MIQHPDYPAINTTIIEICNYYFFNHVIIIIIIIIDINPRGPLTIQHFTSDSKTKTRCIHQLAGYHASCVV